MALTEITKPEDMARVKGKPIYSAVFLTPESRQELLDWVAEQGGLLTEKKAHHVTLEFKPADVSNLPVGREVSMGILHLYKSAGIQCVSVLWHGNADLVVGSGKPHVTVSHESDVAPKRSIELMQDDWDGHSGPRIGPLLKGVVGVFAKTKG